MLILLFMLALASALGDPVIRTLDGLDYTMNGLGEYVMLIVPSLNFTFQVGICSSFLW